MALFVRKKKQGGELNFPLKKARFNLLSKHKNNFSGKEAFPEFFNKKVIFKEKRTFCCPKKRTFQVPFKKKGTFQSLSLLVGRERGLPYDPRA